MKIFLSSRNASKNVYKFLVGNKCDLAEKRQVTYEQAKEFADQYGMKYMETSAKSAENVSEAFITMTKEIISNNAEKEKAIAAKPGIFYF
jgi:GTPase SAR1 family protein